MQAIVYVTFMVVDWSMAVEVKVNSLDLARSLPLTVPRSNLCGNRAAHQECLTANPGAFLARRASYQTVLHTH